MLATYCQGFGEVAQALVSEALVILVTTLSVSFPCIECYSMEASAEYALALRHQHLWCLIIISVTCG